MEKIDSFKVNHLLLKRGIYVSRTDTIVSSVITTFDIRVCEPSKGQAMSPQVAHTIEHIGATFLRNKSRLKDDVIYFGPMGCLTGFYLILNKDYKPSDIWDDVISMFNYISNADEIPGVSEKECGNYKLHDIQGAKNISSVFAGFLSEGITAERTNYPLGNIVIITAMQEEFELANKLFENVPEGISISVVKSGIGKVNSATKTAEQINLNHPDCIISFGFAGGFYKEIYHKLLIPNRVFYWDVWCGEPNQLGQIQGEPLFYNCLKNPIIEDWFIKAIAPNTKIFDGNVCSVATADKFAESVEDRHLMEAIDLATQGCDMESAAVAQTCYNYGVPFMAFKYVSDIVGTVGQKVQYEETKTTAMLTFKK